MSVITARNLKQFVARFLQGKAESAQNNLCIEASRTRATLVVKGWCSVKVVSGRGDTRIDSEVPYKIMRKISLTGSL